VEQFVNLASPPKSDPEPDNWGPIPVLEPVRVMAGVRRPGDRGGSAPPSGRTFYR
jgi:hypothetical protein